MSDDKEDKDSAAKPPLTAEAAFAEYLKRNPQGRQRRGDAIGYAEEEWLAFQEVWNTFQRAVEVPVSPIRVERVPLTRAQRQQLCVTRDVRIPGATGPSYAPVPQGEKS